MKYKLSLIALATSAVLSGCNSDDENSVKVSVPSSPEQSSITQPPTPLRKKRLRILTVTILSLIILSLTLKVGRALRQDQKFHHKMAGMDLAKHCLNPLTIMESSIETLSNSTRRLRTLTQTNTQT
ncbi:hypothetical protein QWY96_20760 [Vibrio artabrorum]|uniref:Uncharacterized protein n=1 Tax=Vibrio artabrorum TaxID=446374 RepID=A0ABT8CP25_9VIBR|nr:hypothetical protein [Vibrio artabrorum]MDN3702730.1 hypothetical protein [Vibrio artabrorum]